MSDQREISDLMDDVIHSSTPHSMQVSLDVLVEALRKEHHFESWTEGWAACVDEYSDLIFSPFSEENHSL